MADYMQETDAAADRKPESRLLTPATVTAVLAGLALAAVMAGGMFWIGNRFLDDATESADAKRPTLRELEVVDKRELTNYGWIDRQRGVVRIPIERAMELLVKESESGTGTPRASTDG